MIDITRWAALEFAINIVFVNGVLNVLSRLFVYGVRMELIERKDIRILVFRSLSIPISSMFAAGLLDTYVV